MSLALWVKKNHSKFGSDFELLFVKTVLPLIPELELDAISVQYPFKDADGRQRYCDFVIKEGDSVRIAVEIDGYDKRGTGTGMSHNEFVDWQRRQAALTAHGWYVLRFANRDVRDWPERCAEHIRLLLKKLRGKSRNQDLTAQEKARLDELAVAQTMKIDHLKKETGIMKTTVMAFTALILALVLVIVWQQQGSSSKVPAAMPGPAPQVVSVQPGAEPVHSVGASCERPLAWQEAGANLGKTMAVAGPVIKVTSRTDVRGKPTWLAIGATHPNPKRLVLVLWGKNSHKFAEVSAQLEGKTVCAVGLVEAYKGVPQIELKDAGQLRIM